MFEPLGIDRKEKKEVVRLTFQQETMEAINELAEEADLDYRDVIRQAVEYAIASRQTKPRKNRKKVEGGESTDAELQA